jgi:5'-phosphate synthase pdxT subunit
MKKRIGVLAMQGAIAEHLQKIAAVGAEGVRIRTQSALNEIDGLILPGGESTAMGKLLAEFRLLQPLQQKIKSGLPVWGTCAGLILLAKKIRGQAAHYPAHYLNAMDIVACRNAYGSQLDSFYTQRMVPEVAGNALLPLIFIRAPYIESAGAAVDAMLRIDDHIAAARQDNMLVTSFHPELTDNLDFHAYFIKKMCS